MYGAVKTLRLLYPQQITVVPSEESRWTPIARQGVLKNRETFCLQRDSNYGPSTSQHGVTMLKNDAYSPRRFTGQENERSTHYIP
jgi:hypothetical protein